MKHISMIIILICIPSSFASVIHVPGDQPTIQAGIDAALNGDVVLVASGVYAGIGNRDIDFFGKSISVISASGWETCSIDCQGSPDENHRGFIFHSQESSETLLAGFTIMNAYVDDQGGGILFELNSSPSVHQCRIMMNTAQYGAGVLCKTGASPSLIECIIERNISTFSSGGIDLSQSDAQLSGCYIQFNRAKWGGGMAIFYDASPLISNCRFDGNQADECGGAIILDDWAYPQVQNCVFVNNSAEHLGGALFFSYSANPVIGGAAEYANDFENNWAGGGADLASFYVNPQDRYVTTYNRFAGNFSDYYISPPEAFDLTGCSFQITPIMQDVYVLPDGDDSNDGLSWSTAFRTIHHALERVLGTAETPVTVWIGPGIFSPLTTGEKYPLPTTDYVALIGAGIENTFLDAEASNRIFYIHRDDFASIESLTIRGGLADYGGGMYIRESAIHVNNCRIMQNFSLASGGGAYTYSSSCVFSDCIFSENQSNASGGGLFTEGVAGPSFSRCRFISNTALKGHGGGYSNSMFGNHTFDECTFDHNSASGCGGGIYLGYKCVQASIRQSVFTENSATGSGGGIYSGWNVSFDISNCLLTSNQAGDSGGGCYLSDGSWIDLRECTISHNTAGGSGGAVYCSIGPSMTMINSIVWDDGPDEISGDVQLATVSFSDVEGGFAGGGNIDLDPMFVVGPLGDYCLSQIASGQMEDSPCKDSGSDLASAICFSAVSGDICMDQLTTRTDTMTDGGVADMGFHYMPLSSATPTPSPSASGTPAPTSSPSATPTPASNPTNTPTSAATAATTSTPDRTVTPAETATKTPTPETTPTSGSCTFTGVKIFMPSHKFRAGDSCYCIAKVCNVEGRPLEGYPLFIVLDVYSSYFFGPSFDSEFDNYLSVYPLFAEGVTEVQALAEFTWPEDAGSASNIVWYGAMTDPDMTELFGEYGSFTFGWE